VLRDFESHYTEKEVYFILHFYEGVRGSVEPKLETDYKLVSSKNLNMNNVHLFDGEGIIHKYEKAAEIVYDWAKIRLETYQKRKKYQLRKMEADFKVLSAKVRFIQDVISGKVNIMNQKMKDIEAQLTALKYPKLWVSEKALAGAAGDDAGAAEAGEPGDASEATGPADYDYLIRMPMKQLTQEKKQALEKEAKDLEEAIRVLRETPIHHIWKRELAELSAEWDSFHRSYETLMETSRAEGAPSKVSKPRGKAKAPPAPKPEPKAKAAAKEKAEPKPKAKPVAKEKAEPKAKAPAKPKAKPEPKQKPKPAPEPEDDE
jgi:DNA gyrase/topoisomerase IV subunit A